MGTIFVVRHGQAAFGTDEYDRLTPTGCTQARLLGEYFAARFAERTADRSAIRNAVCKLRFDAVFTGTLRRQQDTAQGILEALAMDSPAPVQEIFPSLDEYHPEAVMLAFAGSLPEPVAAAQRRDPVVMRDHFRLLREALLAWAEARTQPKGMPAFKEFQTGAVDALVQARERFPEGNVLVVSSGGPIGAMVAAALNAPAATAVELNLRIRNSSLSEFASTPRRHHLVSFNGLPHLDVQADKSLATYA